MVNIKLAKHNYEVHEDVLKWMTWANDTITMGKRLREAQKQYFRYHNNLAQCKAIEKEFDDLLEGKTQENKAAQAELFR